MISYWNSISKSLIFWYEIIMKDVKCVHLNNTSLLLSEKQIKEMSKHITIIGKLRTIEKFFMPFLKIYCLLLC